MDAIIIIIAAAINGSHIWSVKNHFMVSDMSKGTITLIALNLMSNLALLFITLAFEQPLGAQLFGLMIMLASVVLFWMTIRETRKAQLLAAFDEGLPHGLVTTGPYAYVRHPFYTSYIMLWLGWAISCWHIAAIVPSVFMVVTFWFAARDEEAKFARTKFATAYADYKRATGRFFPQLWPAR